VEGDNGAASAHAYVGHGFGWRVTTVNGHRLDENNSRPEDIATDVAVIYLPALRASARSGKE